MSADQLSRSRDVMAKSLHEEIAHQQQQQQPEKGEAFLRESVDDLILNMSFMNHVCDKNCSCNNP